MPLPLLFADTVLNLTIDSTAAGILGGAIGTAVVAATRMVLGYLTTVRTDQKESYSKLIEINGAMATALANNTHRIEQLTDRIDRRDE